MVLLIDVLRFEAFVVIFDMYFCKVIHVQASVHDSGDPYECGDTYSEALTNVLYIVFWRLPSEGTHKPVSCILFPLQLGVSVTFLILLRYLKYLRMVDACV